MSVNTIVLNASEHPVKSVTISQSSTAELTRTFAVDLKGGTNVLKISGISSCIDKESPRVHGLRDGARVLDIACKMGFTSAPGRRESKHGAEIDKLQSRYKALQSEKTVRQQESTVLDEASQSVVKDRLAQLDTFMASFVKRKRDALNSILELDEQIKDVERQLWVLGNSHLGETAAVVVATVFAKREGAVELQLTYLVSGVSWQPYYELHARTSDGKTSSSVSLLYWANIVQSTGEDWNNTVLTLSTGRSQALGSLSIPQVEPLKLSSWLPGGLFGNGASAPFGATANSGGLFGQTSNNSSGAFGQASNNSNASVTTTWGQVKLAPKPFAFASTATPVFGSTTPLGSATSAFGSATSAFSSATSAFGSTTNAFGSASAFGSAAPPPPETPQGDASSSAHTEEFTIVASEDVEVAGQGTVLDRSPLSPAYHVDGAVTLPSDGLAHKISIGVLDFSAELKYVCVPRKSAAVYIEATVKNTSEYELLAGPVSVFMDDGFVTKTSLGFVGVNESFECVLGVDTALKVSCKHKSRTEREPPRNFAEPLKTTTRTVTMTLTNGHSFDIAGVIVRDAIPLGDSGAKIKVGLRKPEGLSRAKGEEAVSVDLGGGGGARPDATVRWTKVNLKDGNGGEKDGMYEWVCGVAAGKTVRLETEWDVTSPESIRWAEGPRAN